MWTPYDNTIDAAYRDKAKLENALSYLNQASTAAESLATQVTNVQSGINQCFSLSASTDSGSFTSPIDSYLSNARSTVASKITTLEESISSLQSSQAAYIQQKEAQLRRQQQEQAARRAARNAGESYGY